MPVIDPPSPKAQPLLRIIAEAIERGRFREGDPRTFLSYSEAIAFLGRPEPWFRPGNRLQKLGLPELTDWTLRHRELPKIAALIVNKKSHRPSSGFFESHGRKMEDPDSERWWMQEANRAIGYDWKPFLAPIQRFRRNEPADLDAALVREDDETGERRPPDYRAIITVEPEKRGGRACIRGLRITVGDILAWLAAGTTEDQIISDFPELTQQDIRAALAYAADRESKSTAHSRLSTFSEKWAGKLKLPDPDPADPRLTYLLEKYERLGE